MSEWSDDEAAEAEAGWVLYNQAKATIADLTAQVAALRENFEHARGYADQVHTENEQLQASMAVLSEALRDIADAGRRVAVSASCDPKTGKYGPDVYHDDLTTTRIDRLLANLPAAVKAHWDEVKAMRAVCEAVKAFRHAPRVGLPSEIASKAFEAGEAIDATMDVAMPGWREGINGHPATLGITRAVD